jgi:hypothetical protein
LYVASLVACGQYPTPDKVIFQQNRDQTTILIVRHAPTVVALGSQVEQRVEGDLFALIEEHLHVLWWLIEETNNCLSLLPYSRRFASAGWARATGSVLEDVLEQHGFAELDGFLERAQEQLGTNLYAKK